MGRFQIKLGAETTGAGLHTKQICTLFFFAENPTFPCCSLTQLYLADAERSTKAAVTSPGAVLALHPAWSHSQKPQLCSSLLLPCGPSSNCPPCCQMAAGSSTSGPDYYFTSSGGPHP